MAEPVGGKSVLPLLGRVVPIPARWLKAARWVEYGIAVILWAGVMPLFYLRLPGPIAGNEYTRILLNLIGVTGLMWLNCVYFPVKRNDYEDNESSVTELSLTGFVFPVSEKWQRLVAGIEFGIVLSLMVAGLLFLLRMVLRDDGGVPGVIVWAFIAAMALWMVTMIYVPNLKAPPPGSDGNRSAGSEG